MNDTQQKQLGATLWNIADKLRGAMNPDDFRDYMLSFLFLRYLSDNYEEAAKKELGSDYLQCEEEIKRIYSADNRDEIIFSVREHVVDYYKKTQQLNVTAKQMTVDDSIAMLENKNLTPLMIWYTKNLDQVATFEKQM